MDRGAWQATVHRVAKTEKLTFLLSRIWVNLHIGKQSLSLICYKLFILKNVREEVGENADSKSYVKVGNSEDTRVYFWSLHLGFISRKALKMKNVHRFFPW